LFHRQKIDKCVDRQQRQSKRACSGAGKGRFARARHARKEDKHGEHRGLLDMLFAVLLERFRPASFPEQRIQYLCKLDKCPDI
jgi:hypothetical protein